MKAEAAECDRYLMGTPSLPSVEDEEAVGVASYSFPRNKNQSSWLRVNRDDRLCENEVSFD